MSRLGRTKATGEPCDIILAMAKEPIHNKEYDLYKGAYVPKKRTYTVWLVPSNEDKWLMYHCPDCRSYIAQYRGELVCEVPGEAPESMPVMIQCRNPNCGRKILFKSVAEQG